MNTIALICIICGGILLLFIVAIIFIRRSNKKRFQRLQENLNKYKEENKNFEQDNKITLSKEPEAPQNESVTQETSEPINIKLENTQQENTEKSQQPIIEEYDGWHDEPKEYKRKPQSISNEDFFKDELRKFIETNEKSKKKPDKTDDFEDFMNEHAYSRRIFNKDLLSKIRDLPPEIKAVILSNVFNKYDD